MHCCHGNFKVPSTWPEHLTTLHQASPIRDTFPPLQVDGEGFVHLADDGVLRSYAPNGTVIDFVQLTPEQISKQLTSLPYDYYVKHVDHLNEVFRGVDGFDVTNATLLMHPEGVNFPDYYFKLLKETEQPSPAPAPDATTHLGKGQCNHRICRSSSVLPAYQRMYILLCR